MPDPLTILSVDDDCQFAELTATFLQQAADAIEVVTRLRGRAAPEFLDAHDGVDDAEVGLTDLGQGTTE